MRWRVPLGLSLGILPQDGHSLVLAGALISIMLNPILFMLLDRWQAREQAREDAITAANAEPEPEVVPVDITDHAIIVGYGRVGGQLAHLLHERGVQVVVMEDEIELVAQARAYGLPAIRGHAANQIGRAHVRTPVTNT